MSVGEAVKKGFSVMKRSFDLVLALFVFGAVWNIISVFVKPIQTATPDTATTVKILVIGLVFIMASVFVQGGSLGYICEKVKQGSAGFPKFFESGAKYYLRILFLGLLIGLIALALILLATLAVAALQGPLAVGGVIVALLLGAVGIYLALLFFLAPYAIVADNEKTIAAIKKSMSLVKQNMLKLLGILLILVAVGFGIGILLGIGFAALSAAIPAGNAAQIAFGVVSSFINAILGVVVTGSFMSFYLSISNNNANTGGAA